MCILLGFLYIRIILIRCMDPWTWKNTLLTQLHPKYLLYLCYLLRFRLIDRYQWKMYFDFSFYYHKVQSFLIDCILLHTFLLPPRMSALRLRAYISWRYCTHVCTRHYVRNVINAGNPEFHITVQQHSVSHAIYQVNIITTCSSLNVDSLTSIRLYRFLAHVP